MILDDKLPQRRGLERRWSLLQGSTPRPHTESAVWIYSPWFIGNPYQQLLTMAMADHDIASMGAQSHGDAVSLLKGVRHVGERVWHLHWLNAVLAGASTHAEGQQRVDSFTRLLDAVQAQGVRIVWTMHNVLPHESVFEDLEVRIREVVCERAEMIHVMNPHSVAAAAQYFTLPAEKTVRVEHPGYQGYYPQSMTRAGARAMLGLGPQEHVSLVMGAIKPYKGLLELSDVVDRLSRAHPRKTTLLIAGSAGKDPGTDKLLELAALHPAIHVLPQRIAPEDVHSLFVAADTAIIPYKASLNSGALVLALSMGVPVIASSTAGSTHLLAEGAGRVYSTDEELEAELLDSSWLRKARREATWMAHRLRPSHMADVFGQVARAFVAQGVVAARAVAGPDGGIDA